jgi:integrase
MTQLITTALVTTKPKKRIKVFDTVCPGFYASITPKGIATFSLRYWHIKLGAQKQVEIGTYSADGWTVEKARAKALDLKGRASLGQPIDNEVKLFQASTGATVGVMIDDFVAWMQAPVKKADGELRPRIESWSNVAGFLEREVRPAIGWMSPSDVTNNEIAAIQQNIAERSTSGARQTRSAMKRLFAFGAEAGANSRKYGLKSSPVHNLPKVDPETERTVVLTADEIRTFWWGLDHPGLPADKVVAQALKFELVSMLRSKEFLNSRRSLIAGLGTKTPVLRVPLKFVKKRRVIEQPLNSLAVEIIEKVATLHDDDLLFGKRQRCALSQALRGKRGQRVIMGICQFLGLKDFTPHDLRRTAATLCGDIGISDAEIAKCLDHRKDKGENVSEAPTVTGKVYVQSKRLNEKRAVLDALDAELRRIIGVRPKVLPSARTLKLAA